MLAYLKAITALLTTILGSGVITGHWLTDGELILSGLNAIMVFAVPNIGGRLVRRRGTTVTP